MDAATTSPPEPDWCAAAWVQHDMQMYGMPRTDAFRHLRRLGFDARSAAGLIHDAERTGEWK